MKQRRRLSYIDAVLLMSLILGIVCTGGCGSGSASDVGHMTPAFTLSPAFVSVPIGSDANLIAVGQPANETCTWDSTPPGTVQILGDGIVRGENEGSANVSLTCGASTATATVSVVPTSAKPVVITKGGTYSGIWNSDDPGVPAVTIRTGEPVTIQNSTVTGRGRLIDISGPKGGANVQIKNVSGTALPTKRVGLQRGAFINAVNVNSLVVDHCSMHGVSFGIHVDSSQPTTLKITNNLADGLEDRASDGGDGLTSVRPGLGHFIQLVGVPASQGAEIAWNQMINNVSTDSTEDAINIYNSHGTSSNPIWVHDNYLEGYASETTAKYTGVGLITDGSADAGQSTTSFVLFQDNQMVHIAGGGVFFAIGHDNAAKNNRVVSCGQSSIGVWFATPNANAVGMADVYRTGQMYNNAITFMSGGLLRPGNKGTPQIADVDSTAQTSLRLGNTITNSAFDDPCLSNGNVVLAAEDEERRGWSSKLKAAGQTVGSQQ